MVFPVFLWPVGPDIIYILAHPRRAVLLVEYNYIGYAVILPPGRPMPSTTNNKKCVCGWVRGVVSAKEKLLK